MEAPVVHTHTGVGSTEKAAIESDLSEKLSTLEANNGEYMSLVTNLEEALSRLDGVHQKNDTDPTPTPVPDGAINRFTDALETQQAILGLLTNAVARLERII